MKKVLLATTALIGFAGAAAAEVKLSGYAEIGIADGNGVQATFWNDIDVKFDLKGETDSGLTFGATIDLDELNGDSIPAAAGGRAYVKGENDSSVYVSGAFGKITIGDTDGAMDWALTEVYMGTSLADDHSTHAGAYWNTGLDGVYDGQVMRYEYSFDQFAVALSAELDDQSSFTGTTSSHVHGDPALGLGFKWNGDFGGTSVGIGLGYQTNGVFDVYGVSADVKLAGGFEVIANYADLDIDKWWGVGVGYTSGALLVAANYGSYDSGADGWGLVANYDLGGGAVVMAGYGDGNLPSGNGNGDQTWSIGLGLSF